MGSSSELSNQMLLSLSTLQLLALFLSLSARSAAKLKNSVCGNWSMTADPSHPGIRHDWVLAV